MNFVPFDLEYTQSHWDQKVEIYLTESGVHPVRLDELLGADDSFGMDHHPRIAFGQEPEVLEEAFWRMEGILESLK